ncbi:hypothetical protein ASD40_24580 [Paenibacillus sp. Root444D2]|nr:hypothetical protein ASD40_24580 [Paenibacillus sp. Root444D2]KRE32837.1 hypothetical protein ASG85_15080 [Paenibacillus sp. Soil724D2]
MDVAESETHREDLQHHDGSFLFENIVDRGKMNDCSPHFSVVQLDRRRILVLLFNYKYSNSILGER